VKEFNLRTGIKNIIRNICFIFSATAFFLLCVTYTPEHFIGVMIASILVLIISSKVSSIWNMIKTNRVIIHVISVMSALGVCITTQKNSYEIYKYIYRVQEYASGRWALVDVAAYISIICAILGFYFVFVCTSLFWKEFIKIVVETGLFKDVKRSEAFVYIIMIAAALLLVTVSFSRTDAFYGTEYTYDVIYTSDSPSLIKGNVYAILTHAENDIRQPLFAVFAAPFVGAVYFIGRLFSVSAPIHAMLLNYVQIVMLFIANYILTKIMKLNSVKRICFMLLSCCTYTQLLFMQMMEQYIVAYFWLILCIYIICEEKQSNRFVLWGAGGTLLTSMVLLPFMSDASPVKNFRKWFCDMIKYGLEFVLLILVFCRFDILYNLTTKLSFLGDFTGRTLTLWDKVCQYTYFIHNCFFAPDAGVDFTSFDHVSWQLNVATGLNYIGITILVIVVISAFINRDKKSSLLAAVWVMFSVILLLGLGWGMAENGLILYSLYFGWGFMVLVFQLIEKIEEKLNFKYLIPIISVISTCLMLMTNLPAIREMLHFAVTYFPV